MKRLASMCLLLALGAGCAPSKSYRAGRLAEKARRWDEAVNHYTRAATEAPDNVQYERALGRAKLRSAEAHRDRANGLLHVDPEAALVELRIALALNPSDLALAEELTRVERAVEEGAEAAARTSLDSLKRLARERPLSGLKLAPGADRPAGLLFREASVRDVFVALGRLGGVNMVFDRDFQDRTVSLDLRETGFEDALSSICAATQNFFRIQAENIITIVPDTAAKRREYEQQLAKTFYLSHADLKETVDLLRIVLGARRIAPHSLTNAVTLVDTAEKVAAAEHIISTIDKARAEVVVEMELLEVNRSKLDEYGIRLGSASGGVFGGVGTTLVPGDLIPGERLYSRSNLEVVNLPGALLQLLRTDSDTRLLANPRLRTSESQAAQAQFGERVPIPITTFTPLATGGLAQQPVTSFEYQNIGVNVSVTPRLHHNDEMSLALKIQLDNIAGTGFGGLPTFGNRSVETTLRLGDGETTLLAGLIRDDERVSLSGIPGLASVPVLGRIFSGTQKTILETDIVLTLTPRIVKRSDVSLDDLRSFVIEGGATGGALFEVPAPLPPRRESEPEPRPKD
jgi:general secretion pathway protein D